MNELKPCPYCGDKCVMTFEKGEFKLRCYSCHAKMEWFTNEDEAIEAWNKRDCNCDELSYFEGGVELASSVIERYQRTIEQAIGKESAAYALLKGLLDEIETKLNHAINP